MCLYTASHTCMRNAWVRLKFETLPRDVCFSSRPCRPGQVFQAHCKIHLHQYLLVVNFKLLHLTVLMLHLRLWKEFHMEISQIYIQCHTCTSVHIKGRSLRSLCRLLHCLADVYSCFSWVSAQENSKYRKTVITSVKITGFCWPPSAVHWSGWNWPQSRSVKVCNHTEFNWFCSPMKHSIRCAHFIYV